MEDERSNLLRLLATNDTIEVACQINAGLGIFPNLARLSTGLYATKLAHEYCKYHRQLLRELYYDEKRKVPACYDHFAAYKAVDAILRFCGIEKINYATNYITIGRPKSKSK